jgi:hypothetical protein
VEACAENDVIVLQDLTHSVFSSDGVDQGADYAAGSLRKWIGIPSGGFAVKRRGSFDLPLLPPEEAHILARNALYEEQNKLLKSGAETTEEKVGELFWTSEMRLRKIFDAFETDTLSGEIIARFSPEILIRQRRENYALLLERNPFGPALRPVFPELGEGVCPSHLCLYADDRGKVQKIK